MSGEGKTAGAAFPVRLIYLAGGRVEHIATTAAFDALADFVRENLGLVTAIRTFHLYFRQRLVALKTGAMLIGHLSSP